MKKIISLTVTVLLVAAVVLTACGQTNTPSASSGGALEDSIFDNPASSGSAQIPSSGTGAQNPTTGTQAPSAGGDSQTPTTGSQPSNPTSVPTGPANPETKPSTPDLNDISSMDFETFQALSGEDQQKFQESFESWDEFFSWYNAAKDAYEMENPPIEVGGDGEVDMGDLTGNGEN